MVKIFVDIFSFTPQKGSFMEIARAVLLLYAYMEYYLSCVI